MAAISGTAGVRTAGAKQATPLMQAGVTHHKPPPTSKQVASLHPLSLCQAGGRHHQSPSPSLAGPPVPRQVGGRQLKQSSSRQRLQVMSAVMFSLADVSEAGCTMPGQFLCAIPARNGTQLCAILVTCSAARTYGVLVHTTRWQIPTCRAETGYAY